MNRFQFQTVPNVIAGLGTIQELFKILKWPLSTSTAGDRSWHAEAAITSADSGYY